MSPEDFKNKMQEIVKMENKDFEEAHIKADKLMSDLLSSLGYTDGIKIYLDLDKYYA